MNIDLSELKLAQGIVIKGAKEGDYSSSALGFAGDVNCDGYDDIIIGAKNANDKIGACYVIYGGKTYTEIDLANLGQNGLIINGIQKGNEFSYSVSGAGDVNADGCDDIIIGEPNRNGVGNVYLIYGKNNLSSVIDLSNIDASEIVNIIGVSVNGSTGISVSKAGDVNSDGYGDIIIGANGEEGCEGRAYVIYGSKNLPSQILLSSLNKYQGFIVLGTNKFSYLAQSVSTAKDFNNDGYDDVIIGAWGANYQSGASYLIYGGSNIPLIINVTNLNSGGFMIYGAPRYSASGWAVSSAGDINADGYDDLIIGAPNANFYSGIIYVIFGTDYKYENIDVSSPKFIEFSPVAMSEQLVPLK